jgi:hypothetical protein
VIGTDRWRSEPPCVYPPAKAGHKAKRRVGVEYSPSMLEPVRPGAVSPDRALYLPTFSHFVIVNKTSLSFSLLHLQQSKVAPRHPEELTSGRAVADCGTLTICLHCMGLAHPLASGSNTVNAAPASLL